MVIIKFETEKDKINGFYLLATEGLVRGLPKNIFEISNDMINLLNENSIKYTIIHEDAVDEIDKIRDIPTPVV